MQTPYRQESTKGMVCQWSESVHTTLPSDDIILLRLWVTSHRIHSESMFAQLLFSKIRSAAAIHNNKKLVCRGMEDR